MHTSFSTLSTPLVETLTRRETNILSHLAADKSNREIAALETLALSSVKWYVQQIYAKLGVNNRREALARATELGLLQVEPALPAAPAKAKNNLPRQLSRFIGRERDIARVVELLHESPSVTLTGSGGVGKTRLCLAVVEKLLDDFPDGVWLVELAALSDPDLVPQAVAGALDIHEISGKKITASLIDFLRTRRLLLILDNCEHLVSACAQLAELLLRSCAGLKILATSREALGIEGEAIYRVPSLSTPEKVNFPSLASLSQYDAITLFIERAQAAAPGFALNQENGPGVVQICQRLDGIPLAIELAAARLRMMSVDQIATRLDNAFRLLTDGSRTVLPHHQTLRALIDWSYNLLSATEQVFLQQLSVFAGGWTLEAAEAICSNGETLDLLTSLVDKSLVLVAQVPVIGMRYHMLETVRQYAGEKLGEAQTTEAIRRRHLDYYLAWVEGREPDLRGRRQKDTLDRLEADIDNLRAALEWSFEADNEAELRLASALKWLWHIRSRRTEGIHWLEGGLLVEAMQRGSLLLTQPNLSLRAKASGAAGCLRTMQRQMDKAAVWLDESLALYRQAGMEGRNGAAFALYWLGMGAYFQSEYTRSIALGQEGLAIYRETGDEYGQGECLKLIGNNMVENGQDRAQARAFLEENLALQEKNGDRDGMAFAFYSLAHLAQVDNDLERAAFLFKQSLDYYRQVGNVEGGIGICIQLGQLAMLQNKFQQASRWYEEASAISQDLDEMTSDQRGTLLSNLADLSLLKGDYPQAVNQYREAYVSFRDSEKTSRLNDRTLALFGLARAAWAQGDFNQALKACQEADALSQKSGQRMIIMDVKVLLGWITASQGDWEQARVHFKEAFSVSERSKRPELICFMTLCLASMAQRPARQAARLFGAAQNNYPTLLKVISPAERAAIENRRTTVRQVLGENEFTTVFAEGQTLDAEQVLAETLDENRKI